ncbi:hypothetical protein HPP92_019071 [Vanilla planifolia]|uniref:Uncharacterized protein n=1 Tax=Vanilla planifolia TaxID=51239 RepID=A0A835QB30_VANPL|nr:hypothetical protein HPP92_019071 [Vanilla planifolia]
MTTERKKFHHEGFFDKGPAETSWHGRWGDQPQCDQTGDPPASRPRAFDAFGPQPAGRLL